MNTYEIIYFLGLSIPCEVIIGNTPQEAVDTFRRRFGVLSAPVLAVFDVGSKVFVEDWE